MGIGLELRLRWDGELEWRWHRTGGIGWDGLLGDGGLQTVGRIEKSEMPALTAVSRAFFFSFFSEVPRLDHDSTRVRAPAPAPASQCE